MIQILLRNWTRCIGVYSIVVSGIMAKYCLLLDLVEEVYHFAHVDLIVNSLLNQIFENGSWSYTLDFNQMVWRFIFILSRRNYLRYYSCVWAWCIYTLQRFNVQIMRFSC
jgi:hypothetical protein